MSFHHIEGAASLSLPQVVIKTATLRDRFTPTIRLVPFSDFPGTPIPGMLIDLVTPGYIRPVRGYVHSFDALAGVVRVAPDLQTIHA